MIRTALYDAQKDLKATFGDFNGWETPFHYGDPESEYHAVGDGLAILDRSASGNLVVTGADRISWLQGMISNDLRLLNEKNISIQACILNSTGHLLADMIVIYREDSLMLDMARENVDKLFHILGAYIITEDVEIVDMSDYMASFTIYGNTSPERIREISGADSIVIPTRRSTFASHDIFVKATKALQVWNGLLAEGATPVGRTAAEIRRIEAGIPRYEMDMDESVFPFECGLETTHLSFTKGCYVGQEIMARIKTRGHTNRKLVGMIVESDAKPQRGDVVRLPHDIHKHDIGRITSVAHSPGIGSIIALGYLRHANSVEGTKLHIIQDDANLVARVKAFPLTGSAT